MKLKKLFSTCLVACCLAILPGLSAAESNAAPVIEVVTFQLKQGVTPAEFSVLDKNLEREYVSKQPGFVSRESAAGLNNEWLVIVRWASVKDAEASMASFEKAPPAAGFMAKLKASTMNMKRYKKPGE